LELPARIAQAEAKAVGMVLGTIPPVAFSHSQDPSLERAVGLFFVLSQIGTALRRLENNLILFVF